MAPWPSLHSTWTQFFPPAPTFTDASIPNDLTGKVYVVTGANAGLGEELVRVLYERNAKVYLACRSEQKALDAIASLKSAAKDSTGELVFLALDLSDLDAVKRAAGQFLAKESKIHVLFNNAGVMAGAQQPVPKTAQGHELALGVNCIGPFLFTKLLTPLLVATARNEPPSSVRLVWLSSYGLGMFAPEARGLDMANLDYSKPKAPLERYAISKCGNWLLATEFARRHEQDGVVSIAINPGNVHSEILRDQGYGLQLFGRLLFYPTINGVYTHLFAAFSPELDIGKFDWSKDWVIPWGRVAPLRPDLPQATVSKEDGGTGNAQEFWQWNEEQVKAHLLA